jgi:protein XagA
VGTARVIGAGVEWGSVVFKRCVAYALTVLWAPSVAWAGAWTLPEGTGQWIATLTAATSTEYFTGSGLAPTPRYSKEELQVLIEYGLTDRLTAIFIPGLQNIDIAAPVSAQRTGLNYTDFGARYAFYQSPDWVASGQILVMVPGTTNISNSAAIGYTDVETDFRALVGHNFKIGDIPGFLDFEVAQRWRTDGYPSEFRFDGTAGFQIFPRWMLLAQSFNVISEGSGLSYLGGSYEYYKVQLSAVYKFADTWQLQFGGYTTYAGRNALQENGLITAVWHQF